MHNRVVGQHGDDAPARPHATAKPPVTHDAEFLVSNDDMSMAAPLAILCLVTEVEPRCN
jgi:hypothetical protein